MPRYLLALSLCVLTVPALAGLWNDPYPTADAGANIFYSSFSERPKHLDPVRSYSADEYKFIAQIYEPPLQYHYLKRPYELTSLAATRVPEPILLDAQGRRLPATAPPEAVAESVYEIEIRKGIHYQPHPAFARGADGEFLYHQLKSEDLEGRYTLADFPEHGTREVLAEDYVYEIKRLAHPESHSPIAALMFDYIVGLRELADTLKSAKTSGDNVDLRSLPLAGVALVDAYTYRIRIKGKYPQFRYWLAMSFFAPIPWEATAFYGQEGMARRNFNLDWYPVGTGPFYLAENNPNRRMVLARNPYFRGEPYPGEGAAGDAAAGLLADAGRPMPFIDRAVYTLEKENIPYWNKFLQGYYDASGVVSDSFDQAIQFDSAGEAGLTESLAQKGIALSTAVETSIYYMGFNMRDPLVGADTEQGRALRQAIAIAVDWEEYISIFANGRGVSAQSPLPPGIFGYRDAKQGINSVVYDWVDGRPRRKPIEAARRLLARAGYPDGRDASTGKPLVLYFDTPASGPDHKARLDWLRKQFDKLGVQLVIRSTDYNRFREKMRKGTAQIYQWGWNADYPDPENFLFLLYGPNAKAVSDGENASNYDNAEFNALFEQMKNRDNGPQRQAMIDRMVDILRRDMPWCGGFYPVAYSLRHDWVHNSQANLMANNTLKYLRIDPDRRAGQRVAWNQPVLWPLGWFFGVLAVFLVPAVIGYRRRERATA